jgi:iron(III) transport system permease protein
MLPHAIPGIGFAFALVIVAMLAARWFPWIPLYGTIWVIILANVVNRLAYATRVTNAALLQVSQELEDAAAICGVGKLRAIRRIMVPLIMPSLLFAGMWTAMLVFREVSMALMLSNPGNIVFSVHVWTRWQSGAMSEAAAMGVVMVTTLGVFFLIAQRVFRERLFGIQGL